MEKGFENLVVWQKSKDLAISIYKTFSQTKDFSFRNQIERASVSIMNNIAEGHERRSKKEFALFLSHSKGSCGEVRSMLILAKEIGYLDSLMYDRLYGITVEISKMLSSLILKCKSG